MACREFTDDAGAPWTVWDTYPQSADRTGMETLKSGWLTFEHGSERRRMVPAPVAWQEEPDEALRRWLSEAASVKLRMNAPEEERREVPRVPETESRRRRALDQHRLVAEGAAGPDAIQDLLDRSRETIQNANRVIERSRRGSTEPSIVRDPDPRQ